jgi:hypothetical protein
MSKRWFPISNIPRRSALCKSLLQCCSGFGLLRVFFITTIRYHPSLCILKILVTSPLCTHGSHRADPQPTKRNRTPRYSETLKINMMLHQVTMMFRSTTGNN